MDRSATRPGLGSQLWHFARHFLEMCAAMCIGGVVLNGLAFAAGPALLGYPDLRQQSPELALLVIALSLYTGRTGHQMGGDVRHVERDAATVRRSHLGPVRKARWWEPEAVAAAGFVVRMPSLERWVHGHVLAGRSPPCRGCGRRRR